MKERDIKAVNEILSMIKNSRLLEPGFREMLYYNNYPDLEDLQHSFQKIEDVLDETKCAVVRCGVAKEIQFYCVDIKKELRPTTLAIAGSYQQFRDYLNQIPPADATNIRYIWRLDNVRGFCNCKMLCIGDYTTQLDSERIAEYCMNHNIVRACV